MELRDLIIYYQKNLLRMIAWGIVLCLVGFITYFIVPTRYYASGSLFVQRAIYPYAQDHFTYEGYYSQQSAMNYTNSVIGLLESEDIRSQVLADLQVEINEKNLIKYGKKIRSYKTGPQLIKLVTKSSTPREAEDIWDFVSVRTIRAINQLNYQGDPYVNVSKILDKPIIKDNNNIRNLPVFCGVGFFSGFFFSLFAITMKIYLRKK